MHPACRVAVLVPVYDENIDTILYSLKSLAAQTAAKEFFEAVCAVNNNLQEASEKTGAFLQNQRTLIFLRFLQNSLKVYPGKLSASQRKTVEEIRSSGLILQILDLSSPGRAKKINNVGAARDRGTKAICRRFLKSTKIKERGIVGLNDCDCKVSENYIEELIKTFADFQINGAAGKWLIEVNKKEPYRELIVRALAKHAGKNTLAHNSRPQKYLPLQLQKRDRPPYHILINGQNMAIRVSAWLAAGGMPHWRSFEDIILGARVTDLPGDVAFNPNYTVTTLARSSSRVGMTGFGRRVALMVKAVNDFQAGKAEVLKVPELYNLFQLFVKIFHSHSKNLLNIKTLSGHLADYGVKTKLIPPSEKEELLKLAIREFEFHHYPLRESLMERLYNIVPGKKV